MANLFKRIFNKENALTLGTLALAVGLLIGLAIGIPLSQTKQNTDEKAKEILENFPLIDGHNDIASMVRKNFQNRFHRFNFSDMTKYREYMNVTNGVTHTDIKRLKEGKLGAQFWAAYASCESLAKDATRVHLEQLDLLKRIFRKYPDDLKFVTRSDEIIPAFKEGKIASLLGLESGHAIDSSLAVLRMFYSLGIRYMTLTHNCDVPWASNHLVDRTENPLIYGGLTEFGRKVIQEMNRLGMMVDLSHVSRQTMLDALKESKAPVIFSHSSSYSICNNTRNPMDDVLLKLKENNGILMINFNNFFITCQEKADIRNVLEHINYVKNLIGVDHIGLGSDYDGVTDTPSELEDVSKFPNLVKLLLKNGWSDQDIEKVTGRNIMRVFSAVEKYAESLKNTSPYDDLIPENDLTGDFKTCRS